MYLYFKTNCEVVMRAEVNCELSELKEIDSQARKAKKLYGLDIFLLDSGLAEMIDYFYLVLQQ